MPPNLARQIGEVQRTVRLRQGVVVGTPAAGLATIRLGGSTTNITGVRCLESATVTDGNAVWVLQQGYDLLVLGKIGASLASPIPVGVPLPWPATTAPAGWVICDGAAVPAGCPILTSLYGANLPNLKGRVIVGRDAAQTEFDTVGETGGFKTHTLTSAEMPSHVHPLRLADPSGSVSNSNVVRGTPLQTTVNTPMDSVGGGGAHNNLQPYMVFNYIVQAA